MWLINANWLRVHAFSASTIEELIDIVTNLAVSQPTGGPGNEIVIEREVAP